MTHRHYGVPVAKPRPSYSGPSRAAALSGGAIVGGIVVILIVLGLVLYGMSKIITDAANTATSAPLTTAGSRCAPTQRDGAIAFSRRTGSEEALGSARLLDALNGTLAQSDRVALALLCKLDDALRYELGSWISSINKPQLAQGFLKGSQ